MFTSMLVLAVVLAEVVAQTYTYFNTGSWFKNKPLAYEKQGEQPDDKLKKLFLIHPYFGYVWSKETTIETLVVNSGRIKTMTDKVPLPDWASYKPNNHGFFSPVDYPLPVSEDDSFVIGIFGGSAGQWFSLQGAQPFIERLSKIKKLEGKNIKVLNFSVGGFKQPQQLMVLNYFLSIGQKFDFVINIDGFNMIALSMAENIPSGVDASMPRCYPQNLTLLSTISNEESLNWVVEKQKLRKRASRLRKWEKQRWSAVAYYLTKAFHRSNVNKMISHEQSAPRHGDEEKGGFFNYPSSESNSDAENMNSVVDLWSRSSLQMNSLATKAGSLYIHVLQPNQYHSIHKLSKQERKLAISDSSPYAIHTKNGYQKLIAKGVELRKSGVQFFDATAIFDDADEIVYADNCSHYNDTGNALLAEFIADNVEKIIHAPTSPQ